MKIKLLPAFLILVGAWFFLTNAKREPNNPPTGRTGAPGELTCQASDCHGGGNYTGTVSISGVPDTVVFGQTYPMTLTNASNAVRAGFELTCLDGNNAMCGSLVATAGVSIGLGTGGRRYARQSSPKLLNNGTASWNFTWKAPTSAAGDSATFYFVTLCANNNGNDNGDNVLQSKKTVYFQAITPVNEPNRSAAVSVNPTIAEENLHIELLEASSGTLYVMDLQGRKLMTAGLTAQNEVNISQLAPGTYLAVIEAEGKTATKKFIRK